MCVNCLVVAVKRAMYYMGNSSYSLAYCEIGAPVVHHLLSMILSGW